MPAQVPEYIQLLNPYVPGKPIEETQREYGLKRVVKLASNENPLGPSPKAISAAQKALRDSHRYPDANAFYLKMALASLHKTSATSIVVGNGSNEVIDFLIRTYCLPGDAMVTSQAAFIAYKICAQIHGVQTIEVPATKDLRFDLPAILETVKKNSRAKIVFIANPNNPTGTYVTNLELRTFLDEIANVRGGSVTVVLDYAYWEYVTVNDMPDPMDLVRTYPFVVMLRTFSKIFGLAGFRVGYGVADPSIISVLEKVRQPFNLNSAALAAATASLSDHAFIKRAQAVNLRGMKFWTKGLNELKIPFWPSQGNFLLLDVEKGLGMNGHDVYMSNLKRGVIFRPVTNYGLKHALRISIGLAEENEIAFKALKAERDLRASLRGKA